MIGRAIRRRCPRCGEPAFESWFRMREHCPSCGHRFEREPGYWVGAVIINTTVTFAGFVLVFTGLVIASWPDVPWALVMGVTVGVNLVVPIFFYPISKTIWAALELGWHPLEQEEIEAAARRASASR